MPDPIADSLATDDGDLEHSWNALQKLLGDRFGESPGVEGILFLIGVQEQGRGFEPKLKKEHKQDLIMHGTYCVFEVLGLYRRIDEQDGDVVFERQHPLPNLRIEDQEKLLRVAIIRYFDGQVGFDLMPPPQASD